MEKIKFSCLMSVYKNDKSEYVKIAIDSILNQTLKPNQYVIMVDGPIDEELKQMLLKYKKKQKIIELYFRDVNKGLGITLNEGLGYCKYNYVARMDADDFCHNDRFEKQITYLSNHPDVDLIGSNIDEYNEKLITKNSTKITPEKNKEIYNYMKSRNPFNHMSVIYKKDKVLECGNYVDCPFFEDYYLWCRMASKKCVFYNIQESLLDVRGGLEMINRRGGIKYIKSIYNFELKLLKNKNINFFRFILNLIERIPIAIVPNKVRLSIYKILLRK